MAKWTAEQEADYALQYDSDRSSLSKPAQLEYDRLLQERQDRAQAQSETSDREGARQRRPGQYLHCSACGEELTPDARFCASCGEPANMSAGTNVGQSDIGGEETLQEFDVTTPESMQQEHRKPPPTIGGWSFFDKTRFRWGGVGDIVFGISLIGGVGNAGGTIFGILFIMLGIATWIYTRFGGEDTYSAWNSMSTTGRVIAGTGSVIGILFLYILFFWFVILRWFWKYIIDPGLRS